jgi:hypothetical protein
LRPPVDDVVVNGMAVEPAEHRPRRCRDMAHRIILAHEVAHGLGAVEPHEGGELDLIAQLSAHQVDLPEAGDLPRLDVGDHLTMHDALVGIGVFLAGPPPPNPADHFFAP